LDTDGKDDFNILFSQQIIIHKILCDDDVASKILPFHVLTKFQYGESLFGLDKRVSGIEKQMGEMKKGMEDKIDSMKNDMLKEI